MMILKKKLMRKMIVKRKNVYEVIDMSHVDKELKIVREEVMKQKEVGRKKNERILVDPNPAIRYAFVNVKQSREAVYKML
ncbi:conserved hypothetical protein [Ricinus communis]|uniref:Uncharacterized protein n=1 Tax=Ricinus communis TaxID=3988 RepID=B9RPL7_RICCO|nr:conserved hypothetical protein [Ricinus communis]